MRLSSYLVFDRPLLSSPLNIPNDTRDVSRVSSSTLMKHFLRCFLIYMYASLRDCLSCRQQVYCRIRFSRFRVSTSSSSSRSHVSCLLLPPSNAISILISAAAAAAAAADGEKEEETPKVIATFLLLLLPQTFLLFSRRPQDAFAVRNVRFLVLPLHLAHLSSLPPRPDPD